MSGAISKLAGAPALAAEPVIARAFFVCAALKVDTRSSTKRAGLYCEKKCAIKFFICPLCIGTQVYQSREDASNDYHERMHFKNGTQTLLIDADDTLWENNIYFERAIANFITFLDHREHTPEMVRLVLNDVERESIVKHGYGLNSFAHSLVDTFERLSVEPITPELHKKIHSFCHHIVDHPIEIISGVPETLQYLGERHHLIMMTKGNPAEQSGKVERSGLKEYFSAIEIVAEKDESTYRSAIAKYALSPDTTWMVGNSPKSDINPALSAGLHAVFVPHGDTWILEHEDVAHAPPNQQLLTVEKFTDLKSHF
jgi:putative hydrolase of the HAD superfamily